MNIEESNVDYYRWMMYQVNLLKNKDFDKLDLETLIEEMEQVAINEHYMIETGLRDLVYKLLCWATDSSIRESDNEYRESIFNDRFNIIDLLDNSPSLKTLVESDLNSLKNHALRLLEEYGSVKVKAVIENWSLDDILDDDFWPKI